MDEVFSPQQAILDEEILGYAERAVGGLACGGGGDALALIAEGVAEGGFAAGLGDGKNGKGSGTEWIFLIFCFSA